MGKKLEEATQVGDKDKTAKVKKMLTLVSKVVADFKKACKKAPTVDWGATELANLIAVRDQLEDLAVETDLVDIKDKLVEAAKVLKTAKALLEKAWKKAKTFSVLAQGLQKGFATVFAGQSPSQTRNAATAQAKKTKLPGFRVNFKQDITFFCLQPFWLNARDPPEDPNPTGKEKGQLLERKRKLE